MLHQGTDIFIQRVLCLDMFDDMRLNELLNPRNSLMREKSQYTHFANLSLQHTFKR